MDEFRSRKGGGHETAIKPSEIIRPRPNTEMITSLEGLESIVKERGPLFINRLENLAAKIADRVPGSLLGWESISRDKDRAIGKTRVQANSSGALFTTNMLCALAVYALREALKNKILSLELQPIIIQTIFNRENWGNSKIRRIVGLHSILEAREGRKKMYLDPTYRQIDHRFPGTIAVIRDNEFDTYYFDPGNGEPQPVRFGNMLKIAEEDLKIRANEFQPLLSVFK